jgi:hypothetical protein
LAPEQAFDFTFTPPAREVAESAPLVFKTVPDKTVEPPVPEISTTPEKAAEPPGFSAKAAPEIATGPSGFEFSTVPEKPPEGAPPLTVAKETEEEVKTDAPSRPARSGHPAKASALADFLSFRRMITPTIVQIIFWVGTALSLLVGGFMIAVSATGANATSIIGVIYGLVILLLGPLVTRIQCELLIVFFRMHETLVEIKEKTEPGPKG